MLYFQCVLFYLMSIILLQYFRIRCEARYIVMKNKTSAKHLKGSLKETRLYSGKHKKNLNYTKMVLRFYKNYFNMLFKSVIFKS